MSYKKGDISENPDTGENEVWDGESWVPYTGKVLPVEQDNTDTDVPQIDPNAEIQPASTATPPQGYLETAVNQLTSGQFPGGDISASLPGLLGAAPANFANLATGVISKNLSALAARSAAPAAAAVEQGTIGEYTLGAAKSKGAIKEAARYVLDNKVQSLGTVGGVGATVDYALNKISELFD